jgi:hypothetical protein
MEIDKDKLVGVIEALIKTAHQFEREMILYQLLFHGLCQKEGLTTEQIQQLLDRTREVSAPRIAEMTKAAHQDLLAKAPRIVELLDANRDEFLRLLKEWTPQGPPN